MKDNKFVIAVLRFEKPSGVEDGLTPGGLAHRVSEWAQTELLDDHGFGFGRHWLRDVRTIGGDHPSFFGLSFVHQALLRRALEDLVIDPNMPEHALSDITLKLVELKAATEHAVRIPEEA